MQELVEGLAEGRSRFAEHDAEEKRMLDEVRLQMLGAAIVA